MTHPATATRREFATILGCKPGYVTQLITQGRAELTADGKLVKVPESLARIRSTRDPAHQPVADRHAAARGEALADQPADQAADEPDAPTGTPYDFQGSKAKREHYAAEREHIQFRKEAGELMERGDVVAAFADAGAIVRSAVESWANDLPPTLVGQGEDAIRSVLADHARSLLSDMATRFNKLAGTAAANA